MDYFFLFSAQSNKLENLFIYCLPLHFFPSNLPQWTKPLRQKGLLDVKELEDRKAKTVEE